jgi:hypothetical protein
MINLKLTYLLTAVITFIIVSCYNNHDKDVNKNCSSSYELIGGDTVNIITCRGKQGKWIPSKSNKLEVMTYYKNDTIIKQ